MTHQKFSRSRPASQGFRRVSNHELSYEIESFLDTVTSVLVRVIRDEQREFSE